MAVRESKDLLLTLRARATSNWERWSQTLSANPVCSESQRRHSTMLTADTKSWWALGLWGEGPLMFCISGRFHVVPLKMCCTFLQLHSKRIFFNCLEKLSSVICKYRVNGLAFQRVVSSVKTIFGDKPFSNFSFVVFFYVHEKCNFFSAPVSWLIAMFFLSSVH